MTPEQIRTLTYFSPTEKRTDGSLIAWSQADFLAFAILDDLREDLGAPIRIIRETHPNRPGAVDFTVPSLSMAQVFPHLDPRPCAVGYYAGHGGPSYHLDCRADLPHRRAARWLGVRPSDRSKLGDLTELIYSETDEWLYLRWADRRSFQALLQVMALSELNRQKPGGPRHV